MAQDRHRQLGQIFEREHVDLAVASEQERRIEIVAPEAGAVADGERRSCSDLGRIEVIVRSLPVDRTRELAVVQT